MSRKPVGLQQRLIVLRLMLGHHVPYEAAASEIGGIVGEVGSRENGKKPHTQAPHGCSPAAIAPAESQLRRLSVIVVCLRR